ncbi:MAG: DUF3558 family protein [Sciscionella sp.]
MSAPTQAATLATVDPCSLLPRADAAQVGVTGAGNPENVGTARGCAWHTTDGAEVSVDVRTNLGLSQVQANGGTVGPVTTLGSHQSRQQQNSVGCLVAIGVTAGSRVDVQGVSTNGTPDCSAAQQAAKVIEPNLPKS